MTPLSLLESARQGNPTAIAALMNLTLSPKGVTAKATLHDRCLHVFLSSDRALNQTTLVSFTQHGMVGLGVEFLRSSIQLVKVYGQKSDEERPLWMDAFTLTGSSSEPLLTDPLVADTDASPSESEGDRPSSVLGLTSYHTSQLAQSITQWIAASKQKVVDGFGGDRPSPVSSLSSQWTQSVTQRFTASKQKLTEAIAHVQLPVCQFEIPQPQAFTSSRSIATAAIVTAVAFMSGGFLAGIASYNKSDAQSDQINLFANAADPQAKTQSSAAQSRGKLQEEARTYLVKMNAAQRKFYLENKRLASSLEDLERSASIISQSSHYAYKLTLLDQKQAKLVAIPKAEGLKSFTAMVVLTQAAQGSPMPVATLCESQQPTSVAPNVTRSPAGALQCASNATKVSALPGSETVPLQ